MIFRQLFDADSCTYSYLIASNVGREAVIIDPVKGNLQQYLQLVQELDLRLVQALDTHTHADHVTALGALRDATGCISVMGEHTQAECVSRRVAAGESLNIDGIDLTALYTPGHTDESYSFLWRKNQRPFAVFTGDVLLYRGTGRTDFQGGDPQKSWHSITQTLFPLGDETRVYAGHDYKGWTVSTIGEERIYNPRLAGKNESQYVEIMNNLNLPDPKMMDIAIPANLACGQSR